MIDKDSDWNFCESLPEYGVDVLAFDGVNFYIAKMEEHIGSDVWISSDKNEEPYLYDSVVAWKKLEKPDIPKHLKQKIARAK